MSRMNWGKRQRQLICLSLVCAFCAGIAVACASASPVSAPTLTPTTQAMRPTATPPAGVQLLHITVPNSPGNLVPTPDGSLIAGLNSSLTTVTVYDLTGRVQGEYTASAGYHVTVAWLPDSSALFAWESNGGAVSGQLVILDRQGHVQMTGVDASDPFLSPDGQWIAATHFDASGTGVTEAEVLPRAGGAARVLAQGADVLGWQGNHVVYWAGGNVYAAAPTGGTPQLLTQVPGGEYLRPIDGGQPFGVEPATSPDGQVLIADGQQDRYWMLVGTQVQRLPSGAITALPVFWAGPHQVAGGVGGDLVVLDLISGAVVRDTGFPSANLTVQAAGGNWIAATASDQTGIIVINDETKAHVVLDALPVSSVSGKVAPLGQGKFLVYSQGLGGGEADIVDPSLASGS